MRVKRCRRCGEAFPAAAAWNFFCPACALKNKQDSVVRVRVCVQCGTSFDGGPRASYCPKCRVERARIRDRAHKRNGSARPLGSTDVCLRCGQPYTVNSGLQKYCPSCASEAVKEVVRPHKQAYAAQTAEHYHNRRKELSAGAKVCAVCGGPILSSLPTVTCSPACATEYRRQQYAKADFRRGRRQTLPPSTSADNARQKKENNDGK